MNDNIALDALRRFFTVVARGRTYANVAYIWIGFPLGIFYFVLLVTGSALSLGLALLWIGLAVAILFLLSIWGLEHFERLLSDWLLGERVETQKKSWGPGFWRSIRNIFKDSATWKGAIFLFLKFPIGLACWVASVVAFSISAALIVAPFNTYGELDLGLWMIQDPTGGWLLSIAGILLLFVTLHLHNAMGLLWRLMARYLLGAPGAQEELPQAA